MPQIAEAYSNGNVTAKEQITGLIGGQVVPVAEAPLTTSADTPWSGFLLEIHAARVIRHDIWWGWHRTHVCVVTSGTLSIKVRGTKGHRDFHVPAGSVLIFPSGFAEAKFEQSDFELICVELDPHRVAKFLGRRGPAADGALNPRFGLEDSQIRALLTNMAAEVAEGCRGGNLYGESLSLTLAAYLEGRFSKGQACRGGPQRRFSEDQTRLLVDYIRANLAVDLNLSSLAELLDISPRQFFRMFANTLGCTPHRYVMKERVARASELLAAKWTLAELADALGFASQSHFSNVFQKTTGMSPGRFRARFQVSEETNVQ
jgi:AraC family transcriptional regulator